jgi:cytochrome P450
VSEQHASPSVAEEFNPFFGPFVDDPAPVFARARAEEPVFFSPVLNSWVVTRYQDVVTAVRDPERFSSFEILSIRDLLSPEVAERFGDEIPMEGTLIGLDPPAHTRLRRIMQDTFTPSRVAGWEKEVESLAGEFVDAMVDAAGAGRQADLISSVLFPLPLTVVLRLIGIPDEELERSAATCKDWNDLAVAFLSGVPLEEQLRMADAVLAFHRYILDLVAEREREPADDLVSALVAVRRAERLNDRELLSLLPGLVLAGHETTANLLANTLAHVLVRPGMWERICKGTLAVTDVVEETLRFDGPVIGMPRIVTVDTELGGARLRAGDRLYLSYWSANRDEQWLPDADRFFPGRQQPPPHLAFGRGIHHCIGAPLGRLEASVTIGLLATRLPGLRLVDGFVPTHLGHFFVRKLASLPVTW